MLPADLFRLFYPRRRGDLMRKSLFLARLTVALLALSLPLPLHGFVALLPPEQTRTGERGLALGSGPIQSAGLGGKRII